MFSCILELEVRDIFLEKLDEVFLMVFRVGQQIGSYRIIAEVSRGAHATVYQAAHSILDQRIVALKLLHASQQSPQEDVEEFFREARMLEKLTHPYILPLLDANMYEGFPYIVTEFAVNGSLRNRLNRHSLLPFDESLRILKQIGQALHFAHQQKVVHSDVKPENILFNARDEAVMADFDIARALSKGTFQAVGLGGTPSYMAPEQFQGKVRKESDQYALGCIAYELATGSRPFKGEDTAKLRRDHLHETPLSPALLNPDLSSQAEWAILKAMAKKPAERYEDIATFIEALSSVEPLSLSHEWSPLHLKSETTDTEEGSAIYYEKTELAPQGEDTNTKATRGSSVRKRRAAGATTASAKVTTSRKSTRDAEEKPARSTTAKKKPVETTKAAAPAKKSASKKTATSATGKATVVEEPTKAPQKKTPARSTRAAGSIKRESSAEAKKSVTAKSPTATKRARAADAEAKKATVSKPRTARKAKTS